MRTIDYLVTVHGTEERERFYNEMYNRGFKDHMDTKEEMIESSYPFAICLKNKKMFLINSATICYMMSKNGRVLTKKNFVEKIIKGNKMCKYIVK